MQRRIRRSTNRSSSKGITVFTLLAILGTVALTGIVGSIVTSVRDGYRRQPKQTFARTA